MFLTVFSFWTPNDVIKQNYEGKNGNFVVKEVYFLKHYRMVREVLETVI